jgi:hypothetical protein
MPVVWKVLAALFLVLPVAAYVAGTLVGPYDTPAPRNPVVSPSVSTTAPGSPGPRSGPDEGAAGPADVDGWSRVGGAGAEPSPAEPTETDADEPTTEAAPRQSRRDTPSDTPGGVTTTAVPSDSVTESTSPIPSESPTETPDETPTETADGSASRAPARTESAPPSD